MQFRLPDVEIYCPADTCSDCLRLWMETEGARLTSSVTFETQITVLYVDKTTLEALIKELPGAIHTTRIVVVAVKESLSSAELRGYLAHTTIDHWFCGMPEKSAFIAVIAQLAAIGNPLPARERALP